MWGCVTDAGYDGTYLGVDKIQNEYLRENAQQQIAEYAEDKYAV